MTKSTDKNVSKLSGKLTLNGEPITNCTKIEIVPVIGQQFYAINLRFIMNANYSLPLSFADKKMHKLSYTHPSLAKTFEFDAEYLDMGLEDNASFSELSIFMKGRKVVSVIQSVKPQLVLV